MRVLLVPIVILAIVAATVAIMYLRKNTPGGRRRQAQRRSREFLEDWDSQPWEPYMRIEKEGYWHIGVERVATDANRTLLNGLQMYRLAPDSAELDRQIHFAYAKDRALQFTEDRVRSYEREVIEEGGEVRAPKEG